MGLGDIAFENSFSCKFRVKAVCECMGEKAYMWFGRCSGEIFFHSALLHIA